jgi:hypothetical protein
LVRAVDSAEDERNPPVLGVMALTFLSAVGWVEPFAKPTISAANIDLDEWADDNASPD